jgi:SSS family solute:Na+ symporter
MGTSLHWIDYLIIIATLLAVLLVGVYFSKSQKSSDKYFAGGKKIPSWVIGMSIFATLISSVTFLAYPSAAYASNWILLVQGLMVPVVLIGMIWIIVPLFRRIIRLSAYEYFERRFGFFARMYSSIAFSLTHFSKMGTVLYLVVLALNSVAGVPVYTTIIGVGLAIVLLTLLGGIEAVIWMDLAQGFLLIFGGLICLLILLFAPEGGPMAMIDKAFLLDKISFGPYDWDFTQLTFIVMVCNGIFYAIQKYGTDQTIIQRYLTAKDEKGAKKAAYIGVFMSVPVWTLFMCIGTALFVYYQITANPLPEGIKADQVFPFFMKTQLPAGVVGLVLAALLSAAISSLDSDMNSLSAVCVQDYYQRFKPDCTDKQRLRMGRFFVLLSGLGCIGVALLYAVWEGEGVLGIVFELYAIFSAGIVGIFLLGLLSKRANKQGLSIGIVVCVLFTAYAVLTTTRIDTGSGKQLMLDLGAYNFPHHKYMLGVYSHLIVLVVGYFASFFFKSAPVDENLTIYGYFKQLHFARFSFVHDRIASPKEVKNRLHYVFSFPETLWTKIHSVISFPETPWTKIHSVMHKNIQPITFYTPGKIVFGADTLRQLPEDCRLSGYRRLLFLIASPLKDRIAGLIRLFEPLNIHTQSIEYTWGEPTVELFQSLLKMVRDCNPDCVIGIGGGSVLDTAKLLAALHDSNQKIEDVFGKNRLSGRKSRLICIPSTSGTGSEVSPNAILLDEKDFEKKGVISPFLLPDSCYIDPVLMLALPPKITAETAMDALSHCIEAYTNRYSHPATDVYALAGIRLIAAHLETAYQDGNNRDARSALALGSMYGGFCLGPVNTAAVHALSYGLGGKYHISHGLANAILLPEVMKFNLDANPEKHREIALAMGAASAEEGIEKVKALSIACGIPQKLSDIGIELSEVENLADLAMKVTRLLVNNPKEVKREDAIRIYKNLF